MIRLAEETLHLVVFISRYDRHQFGSQLRRNPNWVAIFGKQTPVAFASKIGFCRVEEGVRERNAYLRTLATF